MHTYWVNKAGKFEPTCVPEQAPPEPKRKEFLMSESIEEERSDFMDLSSQPDLESTDLDSTFLQPTEDPSKSYDPVDLDWIEKGFDPNSFIDC